MKNQSEYYISIPGIVFAFLSLMFGYGLQKSLSPVILTVYFVIVIAEMAYSWYLKNRFTLVPITLCALIIYDVFQEYRSAIKAKEKN